MKYRLALIDDSQFALDVLSRALSGAGFDVRASSSLRRFVNSVLDWRPHVIVTDLHMPDMSGAQLCTWLREQIPTARIPIVFCSSAPEAELAALVEQMGADGYVSKQAGPEALSERLQALCEQIVW